MNVWDTYGKYIGHNDSRSKNDTGLHILSMFWMGSSKDYEVIYSYQFVISARRGCRKVCKTIKYWIVHLHFAFLTTFFDSHSMLRTKSFGMWHVHEKIKRVEQQHRVSAKRTKPARFNSRFKICIENLFFFFVADKNEREKIKREKRISCWLWRSVGRSIGRSVGLSFTMWCYIISFRITFFNTMAPNGLQQYENWISFLRRNQITQPNSTSNISYPQPYADTSPYIYTYNIERDIFMLILCYAMLCYICTL